VKFEKKENRARKQESEQEEEKREGLDPPTD